MNKVIFMGRLTKEPEIRQGTGIVARFSLAVDRRFKQEGQPDADFFEITTFGKRAEFVDKFLKKGMKVLVTGHMQNNDYTNDRGERVFRTQIIGDEIEFCESKKSTQVDNESKVEFEGDFVEVDPEQMGLPFK